MGNMNKQAVLSLSGGMDSSTVLLRLLADGYEVTALSFDYGQKHKVELERAQSLVDYLNNSRIGTLPTGDLTSLFPKIKYGTIKLDGLAPLLNSALVEGGKDVPEGHYEDDNMKETVVPNRIIMPSPKVIGRLIALSILPLTLMVINLTSLWMGPNVAMTFTLTLTEFIVIQILLISPLILVVSGTVIINRLLRSKGSKLLSNWADQILVNMQMNQDRFHGGL